MTTGGDDDGAAPWQAVKLAARLQAATSSGKAVLLRADADAVADREARVQDLADLYAFILWQVGDPRFQPTISTPQSPRDDGRPREGGGPISPPSPPPNVQQPASPAQPAPAPATPPAEPSTPK